MTPGPGSLSLHFPLASLALGLLLVPSHGPIYRPPPPPPEPAPPIPVGPLPPYQGAGPKSKSTPQGPSTPGRPSTPGPGAGPTTPPRQGTPKARQGSITIGIDGSAWTYWWEYNKSAFLLPRLLEAESDNAALSGVVDQL